MPANSCLCHLICQGNFPSEAYMKTCSIHDVPLVFSQLQAIGGIPSKTCDLWEATGSRQEAKFTWDLTRNDNLEWPHKFRPRCRFDRLFIRDAQPLGLKPVYFELVGLERLEVCRRFCSDHWGLLAHLDKVWTRRGMCHYCLTLCVQDAAIFVVVLM